MPSSLLRLASLLFLACLGGCGSSPANSQRTPSGRGAPLPASALAGTVRAIEALVAHRPADCLVQVRALESQRLVEHGERGEYVRVFLHLTLYARSTDLAWTAFEELAVALQEELSRPAEEPYSLARGRRFLAELDWNPPGLENLASFSEALRLEVTPGLEARGGGLPDSAPLAQKPLEEYVRWLAGLEQLGPLKLSPFMDHEGNRRWRIAEGGPTRGHSRSEIAGFLNSLERESPAISITRIEIERSPHQADLQAHRGWTFEAELAAQSTATAPAGTR